ncbi:MAG: ABC transporter permease [Acidobacteria bacterium]|nr:MAG: ABC transporter permease [Acidobacteriota bacterium]
MASTEGLRLALQSLWANKLRTFLTMLGVVIAVAAVIAVVTFTSGLDRYVAERVFRLGTDVFIVSKISPVITNIDQMIEGEKRKNFAMEDYYAVRDACGKCSVVAASVLNPTGHVRYGEHSLNDTWVRGITPSMATVLDLNLSSGRMLNDTDEDNRTNVAVIGTDVVENLFPSQDPLGMEIRLDGQIYRVIGVGEKQGKTLGQSLDNFIAVPISAYLKQYGSHTSIRISGKAHGVGNQLNAAIDEVRMILRARRHDAPGQPDSFVAETNENFLSLWKNLTQTLFITITAIAAIALVVGGIVIMNIMLVSVTERTREIGIRKAMGARRQDVLAQFLIESATVALAGGCLGVIFGIGFAKTITALIGMPSSVQLWSVVTALLVATSVGLFFGVYPAKRAARLDPIAALRFEM